MKNKSSMLLRIVAALAALLLVSATAQAGSVKAQNPDSVTPVVEAVPGALTPDDDWIAAIQSGGTVNLGPGVFESVDPVDVFNSVTIVGAGKDATTLVFNSDGGDYSQQLVMLSNSSMRTRFELRDLSISHEGTIPTDLLVVLGNSHLVLSDVVVCCAWDDLEHYYSGEEDNPSWWGAGLVLGVGATAYVERSDFLYNGTHGIAAFNAERLTVVDSTFSFNWWSGIYVENTNLTVTGSHFEYNDVGIEVRGDSSRVLARNTYTDQDYMDVYEW